jgi:hypothetical protein
MMASKVFTYEADGDGYRCPQGQLLTYATTDRAGYRHYRRDPAICRICPLLASCTRSVTEMLGVLMLIPLPPLAKIAPYLPLQSIVTDIETANGPRLVAGSTQEITPPGEFTDSAAAKFLHGEVREQRTEVLLSLPVPDTQVSASVVLA